MLISNKNTDIIPPKKRNRIISKLLFDFFKFKNDKSVFSEATKKSGIEFIDSVLEEFQVDYKISDEDLKRIPKKTPFIVLSNYPLGGLEVFITIKVFTQINPEFKIVVNKYLNNIVPLRPFTHTLGNRIKRKISAPSLLILEQILRNNISDGGLCIFPASLVSSYKSTINVNFEKAWDLAIIKAIQNSQTAVLPVYFTANKKWLKNILVKIPSIFKSNRQSLSKKLQNIEGKITMRIGNLISVEKQNSYYNTRLLRRYFRSRVYALGTGLDAKKFKITIPKLKNKQVEPIIDAVPIDILAKEIEVISKQYKLFQSGDFSVLCAPSLEMPNLLQEIGRLREITFRDVGEGSNRSIDLDDYDLYYRQLIVWDTVNHKIAGAYRVGLGNEIMEQFGVEGFYINSLFKIKKFAHSILSQSIELGRSFVVKEYQRKPLSLFLLWKGILYYLLKHEEYRYLIGPASISNDFSKFSKNIIVSFFKNNYYNYRIARFFKARKQFRIKKVKKVDQKLFLKSEHNIKNIDKFVSEIENQQGIPVLLKKYIKLNAKLIGFNVDPSFNNCLDGLILLDIYDVPLETLKSLSKEIQDDSILERFNINNT